jgi:ABC-type multidrug transport system ATPase subunit
MQAAIETRELTRSFGGKEAVRGIDLRVPAGAIYAFLGPNGAGKTTTIRMILGLLRPSSGRIAVLGQAMPAKRRAIARSVGSLVETQSLYEHLTGAENLDITRRLLGLSRAAVGKALEIVDLTAAANRRAGGYSLGMRQRLVLARALLGDPELLILDEPANGLDPDGIRDLRALLRRLAAERGTTIFVSSHQLQEIEQIASHVGLMHHGRLIAQGPLSEVLNRGHQRLHLVIDRAADAQAELARRGVAAEVDGERLVASGTLDPPALLAALVAKGFRISEMRPAAASLEDLYVDLTRSAA